MKLKSILLVEDDTDDQQSFIAALQEIENVELFDVVNNGKEALNRLHQALIFPSIIVMDVNMPIMGGMECLEILKQDALMKIIPVILVATSIASQEKPRNLGALGYVKKPVSDKQLIEQIKQFLDFVPSPEKLFLI